MPRRANAGLSLASVSNGRVNVSYERDTLRREDVAAFASLALRGLHEIERLSGITPRAKLRFEVRAATRISTARGRTILLSPYRVASRTAPYLHEIAHVLLPCPHAPPWFSEGLAAYLESLVAEQGAGYDSHLFTPDGNRGVDLDAARWLADPRGRKILPFIGTRGLPRGIAADRHNVAAPFYVLAHSLVKFLADQVGLPPLIRMSRARDFSLTLRRATRLSAPSLRARWLESLRAARALVEIL